MSVRQEEAAFVAVGRRFLSGYTSGHAEIAGCRVAVGRRFLSGYTAQAARPIPEKLRLALASC